MRDTSPNARSLFGALREGRPANLTSLRARLGLSERAFDRAVEELVEARLAEHPTPGRLGRVAVAERLAGLSTDAVRLLREIPADRGLPGARGQAILDDDSGRYRAAAAELTSRGLVDRGRGRGGSLRRLVDQREVQLATPGVALSELRLTAFKSFRDAVLPLRELTLVIGRNGGGKSNALDGLDVLSRLAGGEEVRDALEGGRRDAVHAVRGGAEGCAPAGERAFTVGCSVQADTGVLDLDVTVQVRPDVQILREELWETPNGERRRCLLGTEGPDPGDATIGARVHNGRRGQNPVVAFRASRLLTSQVATRVNVDSGTEPLHQAAARMMDVLQAVFILDPVPSGMRQYWPAEDHQLRRDAENLSAAVASLRRDRKARRQLVHLLAALPAQQVLDVTVARSDLGDVMLAIQERVGGHQRLVPARLMSDGMLRFLAFAVALLQAPRRDRDESLGDIAQRTLVIEEIENGLHPSQAAQVVRLIKEECALRSIRTLGTTHNPALLAALEPADHDGVVLCDRDPDSGMSRLRPIIDLPSYPEALARGTLGDAVTRDDLGGEDDVEADLAALDRFLAEL